MAETIRISEFKSDNNYVNAILAALRSYGMPMTSTELIKYCSDYKLADAHHLHGKWDSPICRTLTAMIRKDERHYCPNLRRAKREDGDFKGRYEYWLDNNVDGDKVTINGKTYTKLKADDEIVEVNGKRYVKRLYKAA